MAAAAEQGQLSKRFLIYAPKLRVVTLPGNRHHNIRLPVYRLLAMIFLMDIRAPKYSVDQNERSRDCEAAFMDATRELIVQAVRAGWREAEAAIAIADAAENYVFYLAEKPKKKINAANSN
jgi:hypothetical protein